MFVNITVRFDDLYYPKIYQQVSLYVVSSGFAGPSSVIHISFSKVLGFKLFCCLVGYSVRTEKPFSIFALPSVIRSASLSNTK